MMRDFLDAQFGTVNVTVAVYFITCLAFYCFGYFYPRVYSKDKTYKLARWLVGAQMFSFAMLTGLNIGDIHQRLEKAKRPAGLRFVHYGDLIDLGERETISPIGQVAPNEKILLIKVPVTKKITVPIEQFEILHTDPNPVQLPEGSVRSIKKPTNTL